MSYKWPDKDADELLDYTVDWASFLGTDTIKSAVWYIIDPTGVKVDFNAGATVNGLASRTNAATSTTATIYLGGGTNNYTYTIICRINTNSGITAERSVKIRIRSK